MIPRTATRHLSVVLRRTEPTRAPDHRDRGTFVTPRLAPEPLDPSATHDEVVRRLSAPMQPQRPDTGSFVTPRLYPDSPADPWEPDVASLIAKVSM